MTLNCLKINLLAMLLVSCAPVTQPSFQVVNGRLIDPPYVTLINGDGYIFKEGAIKGKGQRFYAKR